MDANYGEDETVPDAEEEDNRSVADADELQRSRITVRKGQLRDDSMHVLIDL